MEIRPCKRPGPRGLDRCDARYELDFPWNSPECHLGHCAGCDMTIAAWVSLMITAATIALTLAALWQIR